jgi:hypothetical protein
VQFTFSIGGKEFLYSQCQSDQYWFTQELLPGGKMGSVADSGTWDYSYAVQSPFTIDNRVFFCGHKMSTNFWFIQELFTTEKWEPRLIPAIGIIPITYCIPSRLAIRTTSLATT